MVPQMRSLSEAEVDAVAGGNPGAFAAGVAIGAVATAFAAGVAVGVKLYYDDKEKQNDDKSSSDQTSGSNTTEPVESN